MRDNWLDVRVGIIGVALQQFLPGGYVYASYACVHHARYCIQPVGYEDERQDDKSAPQSFQEQ